LGQQKCRRDKIVRTLLLARVDEEVTGHLDATQGSESRRSRIGYSMRDIELGLILASQELSDMNLSATELFDEICKASAVTVMSGTAGAWTGEGGGSYTRGADSADLEEARSLLAQLSNAIIFRNEAAIAQLMSARRVFALLSPNTICPRQQESLLMLATMSGAEDLAVELLRRGGDMLMKIQHGNLIGKRNALFVAVELGLCRLLDAALSQGVSLDSQVCFEDQFALRPMHVAAQYNKIEVIRLLISRGASVNVRCPLSGLTPLMLSVQFGHEAAARELLTLGANPGIGSNAGRLPLYMAIEKGFISIVKVLVTEFRANIRCPLSSEPSLPHAAYLSVLYNQSFMIPDLIALGADVDIGDASLCLSPLSLAALKGDEEAVKHLLEAGASPMSMSAAGRSAMFHAVERGHVSIVRILSEKFKYLPNTPCKTSHPLEFPLHVAVTFRQTACFGLLVQLGANRHLRNGHGLSAMDLAAQLNLLDDMTRALGETI
jgi:ankyrin repeat protein